MASIVKRGENSYRLTVSLGRDSKNRKIYKSKTIKIDSKFTPKQLEKFLNNQALLFEQEVKSGKYLDNKISFINLAKKWIEDMEAINHLSKSTAERYKSFLPDIENFFDNTRVIDITVPMINDFYNYLRKIDKRDSKYIANAELLKIINTCNITKKELSQDIGKGITTLNSLLKNNNVSLSTAKKISEYFKSDIKTLFKSNEDNNKLSENTILHYHQFINTVLEEAVKSLVINYNPCRNARKPKKINTDIQYLDIEETKILINEIKEKANQPYKTIILLYIFLGCRRSELLALNWEDIDLENQTISINKALLLSPTDGFYIKEPKTEKSKRIIYFDTTTKEIIEDYKTWIEQFIHTDKVFCKENAEYIRPDSVTSWFRRFIKNNNLPDINIHGLRHTNATLLISQGLDVKTVSNRLGHSNTTTTLNVYTHPTEEGNKKAAKVLSNLLF